MTQDWGHEMLERQGGNVCPNRSGGDTRQRRESGERTSQPVTPMIPPDPDAIHEIPAWGEGAVAQKSETRNPEIEKGPIA